VPQIKFLGVFIDDKLSWKTHINYLEGKISSLIGILSKIRFKINTEVSNLIYDSLIVSHLNYCNIIWSSGYKTSLNKLETLQARALKICNRLDYKMSKSKTFTLLNRLTLTQLNKFNLVKLVFLVLRGHSPSTLHNLYILCKDKFSYATRFHNNIFINNVSTNIRKMSPAIKGSILWNKLPLSIRSDLSLTSFKTDVKKLLMSSSSSL
jgi:hypothetical protein